MSVLSAFGACTPKPDNDPSGMYLENSSSMSKSDETPRSLMMPSRIPVTRFIPIRQGTHLPHDSLLRYRLRSSAQATIQVFVGSNSMIPDPTIAPPSSRGSSSNGVPISEVDTAQPPTPPTPIAYRSPT